MWLLLFCVAEDWRNWREEYLARKSSVNNGGKKFCRNWRVKGSAHSEHKKEAEIRGAKSFCGGISTYEPTGRSREAQQIMRRIRPWPWRPWSGAMQEEEQTLIGWRQMARSTGDVGLMQRTE